MISHLIYKLIYSEKFVVEIESIVKIQFHRFRHYISQIKIYIFNRCIVHLPNKCALRSAQWSVDLCLNGLLWQIHNCSSALWSTRSRVWGSHDQAIFPPLYPVNCQESCTFLSCLQNSYSLQCSLNNFCKLTVILTYTVPYNSVHDSCAPKRLICAFVLLWITKWISLNIPISKNSQVLDNVFTCQLNIYYNARHSASDNNWVENQRQQEFYVKTKEKSSHVTKQTKNWSSSNHLTVATRFTTMCPHCSSSNM